MAAAVVGVEGRNLFGELVIYALLTIKVEGVVRLGAGGCWVEIHRAKTTSLAIKSC